MSRPRPFGVLFFCMGNICRSPLAEGVFRQRLERAGLSGRVRVDSAGTHAWHAGAAPDARSIAVASRRGYDLSGQRARVLAREDFLGFDLLLAMDRSNLAHAQALRPPEAPGQLDLLIGFAPSAAEMEVPDPYYGGPQGFERVLDLVEQGVDGVLDVVRMRLEG
jgi:protein-tyrosine phosphatase